MNKILTLALGAAALTAVLAQNSQAWQGGLSINVCPPPAVVVNPAPVPVAAAAYTYYYYPQQQVYYDPARGQYFWLSSGRWLWGPSLPGYVVLGPRYHTVHLAGPWPHHHHQRIYRQYPPHRHW